MAGGIYKITNLVTNDFYIGSTIKFSRRKTEHLYRFNKVKGNSIIKNALIKYGKENFKFEIIEELETFDNLIEREQYYINNLKPKYNIRKIAENNKGIKITDEKILNHLKRIGFQKGQKKPHKTIPIHQLDKDGNFIKEWLSYKEAQIALKLASGAIYRVISGKYKHTKGFFFIKKPNYGPV